MNRSEMTRWLEVRHPAAPPTLTAHLRAQVVDGPDPLPEHLARQGRDVLERVLARPGAGRELARDLLTADALVTYAFEAQAEVDPWGLIDLARRVAGELA